VEASVAVTASLLVAAGLPPHAVIHSNIASIIVKSVVFRKGRDFIVVPPFDSMTITSAIVSHLEKCGIILLGARGKSKDSGWRAPRQPHDEEHSL
jgi:hypothetical protein